MRSFDLELPAETIRSLEVEAEFLEFDSTAEYLAWLVAHRFTVESGTERDQLLARYARRVQELGSETAGEGLVTQAGRADAPSDPPSRGEIESGDETSEGTGADAQEPSDEVTSGAGGDGRSGRERSRVARITDESLADTADALTSVEAHRIDEFARRAVSETSDRLGTSVTSGLSYRSGGSLGSETRPGETITDLDELDVPGWDEDLVERRRTAVGAALAYISETERAKRSDFLEELYEEYPAGYESEDAWWDCIKRGLRQVDRVIPAREDSRIWRFETTPGRVTRISDPSRS